MSNHTSAPVMEYAPTPDYFLDRPTIPGLSGMDDAILVTAAIVCGAIFLIGMAWLIGNSRRPAREQAYDESRCHHPSGRQLYSSACQHCTWHGPVRYDPEQAIADLELHQLDEAMSA